MSDLAALPALVLSVLIVAASAFFVAVEFSLIAARRHRIAEAANSSVAARAALRSARELSLLLAGSQLGITLCLVALGAIAKPAVHHALAPVLEFIGLPAFVANIGAFLLALSVVTFIHLVVGEMAPKSWAISHPETSAIMLAIPMRVFMWVTRPVIVVLNDLANWCLRRIGVQPVDEIAGGQDADSLRELVDHSARAGTLDEARRQQLANSLEINTRPVGDVSTSLAEAARVTTDCDAATIRRTSQECDHLRLLVYEPDDPLQAPVGVVHVRDALTKPDATAADLMTAPTTRILDTTPIYQALNIMRSQHNHLVIVETADHEPVGFVTLQDLVDELLLTQNRPTPSA